MALLFGLNRSDLKWDPDSWRHFRDSAGDERFLGELKLLRAPPKNLSPFKYMDCISQGLLRQHRAGFFQAHANSALFWNIVNAKPFADFKRDDVSGAARALSAMPRSASPVGAVAWATAIRDKLEQAQRGRAFTILPDPVDLWFSALQPWTRFEKTTTEHPTLNQAPKWVQAYGGFLKDCERGGAAIQLATDKFLMQLRQEDPAVALNIIQRFVRPDVCGSHPAFHEAAIQMLEMLSNAPWLSETTTVFALSSTLLESSAGNSARIVSALLPLVPHTPHQVQPFLLTILSACWDCEDVHRLWCYFPMDTRREQASLVLDRVCTTGCYEDLIEAQGAWTQGELFLGLSENVWKAIEQEIFALRPWPQEQMRSVALRMPKKESEWALKLAAAMDSNVEIIHALVGDGWQKAWLQSIDSHIPSHEVISGDVFELDTDA